MIVCIFSLDFVTEVTKAPKAKEERRRQSMGMAGERSLSLTSLIPHNFMCQQLISHALTSSRDRGKDVPRDRSLLTGENLHLHQDSADK